MNLSNPNCCRIFVLFLSYFSTPFIFIIGLILGCRIDRLDTPIERIAALLNVFGAIVGAVIAATVCWIAYKAEKTWKYKIIFQGQHDVVVELRDCLSQWLCNFQNVFYLHIGLPLKGSYDQLAKVALEENNTWAKASTASRRLSCNGFKGHVSHLKKIREYRDFYMNSIDAVIRTSKSETPTGMDRVLTNRIREPEFLDIDKNSDESKWLTENIYQHFDNTQKIESPLEVMDL